MFEEIQVAQIAPKAPQSEKPESDKSEAESVDQVPSAQRSPSRSLRQRIVEAAPIARLAAFFAPLGPDRADNDSSLQDNSLNPRK